VQAGLAAPRQGGNAALATAIALTVVEPNNNGIGGDAFAMIHQGGRLYGLNAFGRSPARLTPDRGPKRANRREIRELKPGSYRTRQGIGQNL